MNKTISILNESPSPSPGLRLGLGGVNFSGVTLTVKGVDGKGSAQTGYGSKENVRYRMICLNSSKHIQFGILEPEQIDQVSEVELVNRELYSITDRQAVHHGVLDRRLV
jgi:hypothetical protein